MIHMNGLGKFLEIARCPDCKDKLAIIESEIVCQSCSKVYQCNSDGIPIFAHVEELKHGDDIYANHGFVEKYAGVYAFGYQVLGRGHMESLHRTVSELILSSAVTEQPDFVLDVGCGVGRATYNCASSFRDAFVVGVDRSEQMLAMAHKIVKGEDDISLDLRVWGFGKNRLRGFGLTNAFLVQGNADCLPFANEVFDMVINVNLFDRVANPTLTLMSMMSVLKPGGQFIFTSPLNWGTPELWSSYPDEKTVLELFERSGLEIDIVFDGLIYREAHDIRSYSDWNTLIVRASKKL
jgi:ubiquinone/menaquinone biosynthesis C-methylase UbiE/uncharacterized protein YbaR (Trm112 family)